MAALLQSKIMGESRKVVAVGDGAVDTTHARKSTQPRISKLKFFTCVDSIKENFKKISAYTGNSRNRASNGDALAIESKQSSISHEDNGVTVTQRKGDIERSSKGRGRRSSFEIYLSTIPKLDPIDRTVGWVLKQPEEAVSGHHVHTVNFRHRYSTHVKSNILGFTGRALARVWLYLDLPP